MTREEAIQVLQDMIVRFVPTDQYEDFDDTQPYEDAIDMAIEALNREQQIIKNGYTGKEMRIRIGGKLFAVRELAQ